jgi:multidrug efflux pump subunit AcrB
MEQMKPEFQKWEKKGLHVEIKGEEKENQKVQMEMAEAAIMAIFLIFIALIWMFDSLFLSLIVLTVIPLSVFGAMIGHLLMGLNLTMPSMLGIVGLAGVVVNDAIVMIDFLKKATSIHEALELAKTRLRPIFLTSITTVFGLTTLMFFADGQSVILQPMAISLGFGLAWSTLVNLFYLPTLYVLLKRKKLYAN